MNLVQVHYCQNKTEQPGWQFYDIVNKDVKNCFLLLTVGYLKIKDNFINHFFFND
jgi:hypothetical protein